MILIFTGNKEIYNQWIIRRECCTDLSWANTLHPFTVSYTSFFPQHPDTKCIVCAWLLSPILSLTHIPQHYSMFWTQAPLPLPMPSVHDVLLWPEFECGVSPIFCSQKWMVASSLVVLGFSISQIDIPVYSDLLNQAQWGNPCNYYSCEAIVNLNFSSLKLVDEDKKDALTCTVSGITAFSMSFGSGHY